MNGNFFTKNVLTVIKEFNLWVWIFPLFFIVNYISQELERMPLRADNLQILLQLVTIIIYMILSAIMTIRFMGKEEEKVFSFSEYGFGSFTFILYGIYYLFSIIIGVILFVIPSLLAGTFFLLAPLIALREPKVSAFKQSFLYVKKNLKIGFGLFFLMLFLEFWGYFISGIEGGIFAKAASLAFSFVDTFMGVVFLRMMVSYYYHCRKNHDLDSFENNL